MTASTIRNGDAAIFGIGGLAVGAILGVVCTAFANKNKKKRESRFVK